MRILLIDPQSEAGAVIARWLDEFFAHVEIEVTPSPAAALAALQRGMPDLVITAHAPPLLDGIELAAMVKSRPNPPPVVVLAAGRAGSVDLWLERHQLQTSLLDFLQCRFPEIWARSVAQRRIACAR